jgi:hydroxyacylglutathione hydrolase
MRMKIITIPVPEDNYAYCVTFGLEALVIDACEAEAVCGFIRGRGLSLRMILSTHHHADHTAGNIGVKEMTGCTVAGGDGRIAGIERIVTDREKIAAGPFSFECIAVPGHTRGCFAYYSRELSALFTGDTLFYSGCGRLFEGSAPQMARSLEKISGFPLHTELYCGHEYTLENLRFAAAIEPDNKAVRERAASVAALLDEGRPSGPSTVELELAANPFLRIGEKAVRAAVGLPDGSPEEVFAELRKRKDGF